MHVSLVNFMGDEPTSINPYQSTSETESESTLPSDAMTPAPGDMASAYLIAVRVLRIAWPTMLLIYLIVRLPLDTGIAYFGRDVVTVSDLAGYARLQQAAEFWIGSITSGALIAAALTALDRRKFGVAHSYGMSLRRYGKILTTQFLFGLLLFVGLVCLVVPGVWFGVRAILAFSIAIDANVHGPTAIRRSFELTRGRFWEAAGYAAAVSTAILLITVFYMLAVGVFAVLSETVSWSPVTGDNLWIMEAACTLLYFFSASFSAALLSSAYRRLVALEGHE
ncbi:MAG: hypothetical protein AAGD07_17535 [Planctomycetota bacterium]